MARLEDLAGLISRLEKVTIRLETTTKAQTFSTEKVGDLSGSLKAFDEIVDGALKVFLEKCSLIAGDVQTIANMVIKAFRAQRLFLLIVSKAKKGSDGDLQNLLKDTADSIDEIQAFREKNRRSEYFNHLSAVSESIAALGWVAVSPAPGPYVLEMNNAGQFYTNRVLKDWKEKSKVHVEWVKSWIETLALLQLYVREHHTTGLSWNPSGLDAIQVSKSDLTEKPEAGPGGPPPPPPPPAAPLLPTDKGPDARSSLLDHLNQGADITKGLKKVSDDQKTHKNPQLKSDGLVQSASSKKESTPAKPPVMELDGKRWNIENINGNPAVVVETSGTNQSVYIYKCNGSTFQVKGKCNNIIMDSCKKSAVVFEAVVSSCEFINCQSVQMQVTGTVPTISVDKTDGCQMYMSLDSLGTQLITSKSSEMNLMVPNGEEFVEHPVPEQFKTIISRGKLETLPAECVA